MTILHCAEIKASKTVDINSNKNIKFKKVFILNKNNKKLENIRLLINYTK